MLIPFEFAYCCWTPCFSS